jgi:uncharacterized glyoxalase superfamily protein PhnB
MMNTPPAENPLSAFLAYEDVAAAAAWLQRSFGFTEDAGSRMLGADGSVKHAEVRAGAALLILGNPGIHGDSPSQGVSTMLIVRVPDVDEHYRRAREAGAEIVIAATDEPWGVRRYQARDPEGHQWQFEQPLG